MKASGLLYIFLTIFFLGMTSFNQTKVKRIVFFGDSITQMGAQEGGYIQRINELAKQNKLEKQVELIGKGIGGNKVYDLYLRMDEDVLALSPDVVFIYVGINDVWHKQGSGTGTDIDKFEKFYQALIRKMKEKNIQVVLCTPSVIGERYDNTNLQDSELNEYSAVIRKLAAANNLLLVDLRSTFLTYLKTNNTLNLEKEILTTDRVHLNAKGNALVAEQMWKVIRAL
jgi:isoamyl acetate esterase